MAKTPGDAKLGAAGTHLMEFSQQIQQEAKTKHPPAKVLQLPLWPEAKRGAPNAVLRGALFPAIQGKNRVGLLRKELIATQDGVRIRYTGAQLDQADLDVWEHALHLARTQALGSECHFTAHGFLKALERSTPARETTSGLGRPWPGWPRPPWRSPPAGGPTSAR